MKEGKLSVLHLEDNENDAELIQATLKSADIQAEFNRVQSRDEFIAALRQHDFDLVISDFSLPSFDGKNALEIARSISPDIPFIFVSGTIGEDRAVESLLLGATDYVLKDRLSRLVPAVRRALQEASDARERRRAEEDLRKSEERFRNFVENINEVIIAFDLDRRFTYVSPVVKDLLGYRPEEIVGKPVTDYIFKDDVPLVLQNLERVLTGTLGPTEFRVVDKTGKIRWVRSSSRPVSVEGKVVGMQGVLTEVTERKSLEGQIRQAQKLESLGTLAGGIAHDFNNILGILMGHVSLLDRIKDDPELHRTSLEAIDTALKRGVSLVRQLLTFARKTDSVFESVLVNDIVKEILRLVRETFPKSIEIVTDLSPKLPVIVADAGQIHQILLNLCVNARDAMPAGGRLRIETKVLDGPLVRQRFPNAVSKNYIAIEVRDSGTGMDEATKTRIFEPFFTTKESGKGTGLGLAVVFGVVQTHKGFIDVESEIGQGSAFRVFLPVEVAESTASNKHEAGFEESRGGNETILFVEDEPLLYETSKMALDSKGYRVLYAKDGLEALDVYRQHFKEIHLVVTDMDLPKMGGEKLVEALLKINPKLKVIFVSGYVEPEIKAKVLEWGAKAFLAKPYDPKTMLAKVREVLDAKN
jgi:PAS domain S-box-containing protein